MDAQRVVEGNPDKMSAVSGDRGDSIYDISSGANFILDEKNTLISANAGFFDITGFNYDILTDDFDFLTLIPDDDVLLFITFLKKRLDDPYNSPKTSEFRILDQEKREHRIILTAARIPETRRIFVSSLELGKNMQFSGKDQESGGDVYCREVPDEGLTGLFPDDQYFHFSYLVENQPDPVIVVIGGVVSYVNKAGVRFFGKENRYEIIGKSPIEFYDADSADRLRDTFEKIRKEKINFPVEESFVIKGGSPVDAEISSVPVIFEGIAGVQYLIRDVTSRKRAQEKADLRLREIEVVNAVLKSASSGFSLAEILENMLKVVLDNLDFQSGWIYLKNSDPSTARLACTLNVPIWFNEHYGTVNIREWPYNIIFYAGQPRYIENLAESPPGIFDVRVMEDIGAISYAGIPLFSENAVVGVLYVAKEDNSSFDAFEKVVLEEIGKETGSIIVKGVVEERFETEYNEIKEFLGVSLKENERIWNSIVSRKISEENSGDPDSRMDLIREISPRMDIINNLRVIYESLLEGRTSLKPICLDSVIRGAIYHFASAEISYDRALHFVFADDNLSYVFINILNMFCAGLEEPRLRITHLREKDEITIMIRDCTGSPVMREIEDMLKIPAGEPLRPSNIPLYVTRMLISEYNGYIGVKKFSDDSESEKVLVIRLKRCSPG